MPRPVVEQSITFLYTDDLEGHAAFYRDVLGLDEVLAGGGCRIFRLAPSSFVGICDLPHRPRGTKGMMLTLLCEDVAAMHAHLVARGVTFEGPPAAHGPDGTVVSAFFRDPGGYALEIQEFRHPDWPYPGGRPALPPG